LSYLDKKVSIIIPMYNSGNFVDKTIESAINQTWLNKEIIIVDDGSEDQSLEIAKRYESENVKIFSQKNGGAGSARNKGFVYATGQFIQFLDADDILDPDKIENQLIQLQSEPEGTIASGPFIPFTGTIGNSQTVTKDEGYTNFDQPIDWLIIAASGKAMFPPAVWLTPRDLIEEAGVWNETLSYNDDSEFFARVLLKSKKIIYCDYSVSFYRRGNPESLGSRKDLKARISEIDSLKLVTDHILNFENSERVRRACAWQYSKIYYSLYPGYKTLRNDIERRLNELDANVKFDFGKGFTGRISKFIGWKAARWVRYYSFKVINAHKS
jgi:glycosyltransferase involved in cell wall biosynthesis